MSFKSLEDFRDFLVEKGWSLEFTTFPKQPCTYCGNKNKPSNMCAWRWKGATFAVKYFCSVECGNAWRLITPDSEIDP